MKALLIYPPDINVIRTNAPKELEKNTGYYPPLGIMSIAAFALEHTDWDIEIIDAKTQNLSYDALEEQIRLIAPDVVALSAMTFNLIDVIESAKRAKKVSDEIIVCVGGPHPTIFPEETAGIKEIDFVVLGEGELVFSELLRALQNKQDPAYIRGLAFQGDGRIINTGMPDLIEDLDSLPFAVRERLNMEAYFSPLSHRRPITTMMSSRGCPHRCIFCDRPHLGKRFRMRSPNNVVDEMEYCKKLGIEEVFFYDDTFTLNKKRALEICREITKRNLDMHWDIRTRIDTVDPELLRELKTAGCERIHYGIESGSPEILKELRKDIKLDKALEVFKYTRKLGIKTLAYFMIGNPGEEMRHIEQTIDFVGRLEPDYLNIAILTPFPGTQLYERGLETGVLKEDYWKAFAVNPSPDFTPRYWNEHFNDDELSRILHTFYRKFYLRPQYLVKSVLGVKSITDLKTKIAAGLHILRL